MTASVTLNPVAPADAQLLEKLWQFYELESSACSGKDSDALGRFGSQD
jgi:hypothetical protein